ncbi:hypothetical protein XCR1_90001 [Xenorhabdus cabanillasii JM26]|uniref:Uncharacterized protein n=1 Tax=Xenorhabdus cabanillasii JM26 TaxID=1427517 RepID=W1J9G7_9GAMM|nr:hypothetical protein XCR1_90001 [Xenorhabdus cabanillasii JM26]
MEFYRVAIFLLNLQLDFLFTDPAILILNKYHHNIIPATDTVLYVVVN